MEQKYFFFCNKYTRLRAFVKEKRGDFCLTRKQTVWKDINFYKRCYYHNDV